MTTNNGHVHNEFFGRLPNDSDIQKITNYLWSQCYSDQSIKLICDHCKLFGTAEGCDLFYEEVRQLSSIYPDTPVLTAERHRAFVESLLPYAPLSSWESFEEYLTPIMLTVNGCTVG